MTWLLDGNVLIALVLDTHEFHSRATRWFVSHGDPFATCAITQGTLLRLHMKFAADMSAEAAWELLRAVAEHPRHEYWDEGFSYLETPCSRLHAPSHVTDAWLARLAAKRNGVLGTFDAALARRHPEQARLLPYLA